MNPVRAPEMGAIRAANLMMNHDPNGTEWIRFARTLAAMEGGKDFASAAAEAATAARAPREGRRRPRA